MQHLISPKAVTGVSSCPIFSVVEAFTCIRELGWVAKLWGRNILLGLVFYGGWHVFLYELPWIRAKVRLISQAYWLLRFLLLNITLDAQAQVQPEVPKLCAAPPRRFLHAARADHEHSIRSYHVPCVGLRRSSDDVFPRCIAALVAHTHLDRPILERFPLLVSPLQSLHTS